MHKTEKSIINIETQQNPTALPQRYWWLRRIAAGYALFVGMVGGLYAVSNFIAERRLEREVQGMRARGEPTDRKDFVGPMVPDEENAAVLLARAGERVFGKGFEGMTEKERLEYYSMPMTLPLSPPQVTLTRKLMAKHAQALLDIRAARDRKRVYVQPPSPGVYYDYHWISNQDGLSFLLQAAALLAHHDGDDGAAVEYMRDILAISRAIDRTPPFFITRLAVITVMNRASDTAKEIAPSLRTAGDDQINGKAATREQAQMLIAELLDDRIACEALVKWVQSERLVELHASRWAANGTTELRTFFTVAQWNGWGAPFAPPGPWIMRSLRPIILAQERERLAWSAPIVEAAKQENLAAATAKIPPLPKAAPKISLMTIFGDTYTWMMTTQHYPALFQRRRAAVALAHRLYQVDHGRPATRWGDLVPSYLPEIPADRISRNTPVSFGAPAQATTRAAGGR